MGLTPVYGVAGEAEDVIQHLFSESSCLGVLPAGVVRA